MSVGRIASRYAKSLIDLSIEREILEPVVSDMKSFKKAMDHSELQLLMKSPIVHGSKKKNIIDAILKGKVNELTLRFLKSIIDNGREPFLKEITNEFLLQYKNHKGISTVKLRTASPLSDEALAAIKTKLNDSVFTDNVIELTTEVSNKLLGGFIVEFGDKRYDASVANKLQDLRKEFDTNLYVKRF